MELVVVAAMAPAATAPEVGVSVVAEEGGPHGSKHSRHCAAEALLSHVLVDQSCFHHIRYPHC